MASEQFSTNQKNIQTLNLLQSTNFKDEYIVNMKENTFDLNFNSLISLHSSSVERTSTLSTTNVKEAFPLFFNNGSVWNFLYKSYTIALLNLAMSHFKNLNYMICKRDKSINLKERTLEYLKGSYDNTDIFKTFSDSIYEKGYSRIMKLPKFGMCSKNNFQDGNEFLIMGSDTFRNESSVESSPYFSLKVNVPITYNQIIQLCSDTIQIIKNNGEGNGDVNSDDELYVKNYITTNIENIMNFEEYSNKNTKAVYSERLLSLVYYNAVLYISNWGLNENDVTLFSATPVNYLTLKCFFFLRIWYINPKTYFKEMQLIKKLLIRHLSVKNIHRFLFDAWHCRESRQIIRLRHKRKISLNVEENLHFPKHSPSYHLFSCNSILEVLKKQCKSMNKNEKDLVLALSAKTSTKKSDEEIKSLRSGLQKNCLNIFLLFLGLVYGISWRTIKKLTHGDIINLVLGIALDNRNESFNLPHIMGLPSIVLQLLGIEQPLINPFMRCICEENGEFIFEFGPFQKISTYSSQEFLSMKDNAFLKSVDESIRERFSQDGLLTGILRSFKTIFFQNNFASSMQEYDLKTFFQSELNKHKMVKEKEDGEIEMEKKLEPNYEAQKQKQIFAQKIRQRDYFRNSPFTCLFTLKKVNKNHFQFNNIGDIALMAILLYRKHFDYDLEDVCFTQYQMLHFQKLIKDLITWDYVTHGGFELPGENNPAKKLKNNSGLETVFSEPKLNYPMTHPLTYDYRCAKSQVSNVAVGEVKKKFDKKKLNFFTMEYSIDMLRVTSLNFVLRSSSEMIFSFPFVNSLDKDYWKDNFCKILSSIQNNYLGLQQVILLNTCSSVIFDKELSSYRLLHREDFTKFFLGDEIKRGNIHNEESFIEKTRFFEEDFI
nr:MAG: wsv433-like protein [Porcellio scaber clopovirus]